METTDLLDLLSEGYGLLWQTIARVAQVSVPTLRKWCHGNPPTVLEKSVLIRLADVCGALQELGVPDVAAWLCAPVRLNQERERVEFLALPGGSETLLALAQNMISPDQALDRLDPTWRVRFSRSTTEITFDCNGVGTVHLADLF